MRSKKYLFLISCLICSCHIRSADGGVIAAIQFGIAVGSFVMETWKFVDSLIEPKGKQEERDEKLLNKFTELSRTMDQFESNNENNVEWMMNSLKRISKNNIQMQLQMHSLSETMNMITIRYNEMKQYEQNHHKLENSTLLNFAEYTVSSNPNAVKNLLERIHLIFFGNSESRSSPREGILEKVAKVFKDKNEFYCDTWQSPQQFVYSLYTDVAVAELKGYAMMQFSWMRLKLYGKGNFTEEASIMRENYAARKERSLRVFYDLMSQSSRDVWRCDPQRHERGKTYDEITHFWQGSIEDERSMDPSTYCWNDCKDFDTAENRLPQGCKGFIRNCHFLSHDVTFCRSPADSTRRLEYVEYGNGRKYGRKTECSTDPKTYSTYRHWLMECNFCFCQCDEIGPQSDRHFSLREVVSNRFQNRVVTGLRLVKSKGVFHFQIQEGKLLPHGNIDKSSVQWKPIDDFYISSPYVEINKDFYTLGWDERALDLDVVDMNSSFVVTGIRFAFIYNHLFPLLLFTEFDFDKGYLGTLNTWRSAGPTSKPVNLQSSDVPTRQLAPSVPTSQPHEFIEFTSTDWEKDAAQTTVPFIDIQEVTSDPPVPLSGVGLYHKRQKGYGGFVAPKIMTYDFAQHIRMKEDE